MSPNEEQLRAALRQGEGDRPNADRIIASVRATRRTRRRTAWAIAGSVAAVIAIGGGITALSLHSGRTTSRPSAASGAQAAAASSGSAKYGAAAPAPTVPPCPVAPPEAARPSGASPDRLLPNGIIAIRICLYQAVTADLAGTTEVTGAAAQQLADRLDGSPLLPTNSAPPCPPGPSIAILARTTSGDVPVVAGNAVCGDITNGQITRMARDVLQNEISTILKPVTPGRNTVGPGPS